LRYVKKKNKNGYQRLFTTYPTQDRIRLELENGQEFHERSFADQLLPRLDSIMQSPMKPIFMEFFKLHCHF